MRDESLPAGVPMVIAVLKKNIFLPKKKRSTAVGFEPTNPEDYDLNVTRLTTSLNCLVAVIVVGRTKI